MLYFVLLILFILLFFGPIIVSKFINLQTSFGTIPLKLLQPTGQSNNDTFSSITGSALNGLGDGSGATGGGGGGVAASSSSVDSGPFTFTGRMAVRWATVA